MPLVHVHTTLMLPEALVIGSKLRAHRIRFATIGQDIISQCPQMAVVFGGICILVEEADVDDARALIGDVNDVPGYCSLESDAFEKHPIRNAILAFFILIVGAPVPFWFRKAGMGEADV